MLSSKESSFLDLYGTIGEVDKRVNGSIPSFGEISSVGLSPRILNVLYRYSISGGTRSEYVFKWSKALEKTGMILSTVGPEYMEKVVDARILLIILISYIDDIIDNRKQKDSLVRRTLVRRYDDRPDEDIDLFVDEIWNNFYQIVRGLPLFDKYYPKFIIDVERSINALFFTIENPLIREQIGKDEFLDPFSYGMGVVSFLDIDLMASNDIDDTELRDIRDFMKICQKMARISNCLATWEREVDEGTYFSMPIFYALNEGIISLEEIMNDERASIKGKIQSSSIEYKLLRKWEEYLVRLYDYCDRIRSMDIHIFIKGIIIFLKMNLLHRGEL